MRTVMRWCVLGFVVGGVVLVQTWRDESVADEVQLLLPRGSRNKQHNPARGILGLHAEDDITETMSRNLRLQHQCRTTDHDPFSVADSKGFVCERSRVDTEGCCPAVLPSHQCEDCENSCCLRYETCVACCINPEKILTVKSALLARRGAPLVAHDANLTQFSACMFLCRTNSGSTQHQNKYRNVHQRYCFGEHKATIIPTALK
eukprot:m.162764 g.162764  ORF g.162764 m.162764 type:complete len:204 (+) comp18080_c0_seq3:267-878(+)